MYRQNKYFRLLRFEQCEDRCLLSVVPVFSSNPGSSNKIHLDFDGHTVQDALDDYWTSRFNDDDDIHAPVYNMPGDTDYEFDTNSNAWMPLPFSQEELNYIELAWQ